MRRERQSLARGLQAVSAERVFAPGATLSPVRKGKIGREFTGHVFEVAGPTAGEGGEPLVLRGSCVRGSRQKSYSFLLYVYAEEASKDPEMESVLASLRESER